MAILRKALATSAAALSIATAMVGLGATAAWADPQPPCFNDHSMRKIVSWTTFGNYGTVKILNCGPGRKLKIDVSWAPDTSCQYAPGGAYSYYNFYAGTGGKPRSIKNC